MLCPFFPPDAWFNLTQILRDKHGIDLKENLGRVRVELFFLDSTRLDRSTQTAVRLKLKYTRPATRPKLSSLICIKSLYLGASDLRHLHWSLELSKRAGYDRVSICNQSIEDGGDSAYSRLLDSFGGFASLSELQCLPNFLPYVPGRRKYLSSFREFARNGKYDALMSDTFNILSLAQCYLDNIDRYEFVGVFDPDEVVLAPRSNHFRSITQMRDVLSALTPEGLAAFNASIFEDTCSRSFNSGSPSNHYGLMGSYLKDLYRDGTRNSDSSLYFKQGYYLRSRFVDKIFKSLEDFLATTNGQTRLDSSKMVLVPNEDKFDLDSDFHIQIGSDDLVYVRNLLLIHKNIVRPYLDANAGLIRDYGDRYGRPYVLVGNDRSLGKTVHNTNSTLAFTLHLPFAYQDDKDMPRENLAVMYHEGYLSHFRNSYQFGFRILNVTRIRLDLNYFSCYFRPIINIMKLAKTLQ